jgi:hypothetical protein
LWVLGLPLNIGALAGFEASGRYMSDFEQFNFAKSNVLYCFCIAANDNTLIAESTINESKITNELVIKLLMAEIKKLKNKNIT